MAKEVIKDQETEPKPYIYFTESIQLPYRFHGPMEAPAGYYHWYPRHQEFAVLVHAGGDYYSAFYYTLEEVEEHNGPLPDYKFYMVSFRDITYREEVDQPE